MASSSVETEELSSAVENKNITATTDAADVQKSRKNLSSSSSEGTSSPDSPLDDPFGKDKDTFQKWAQSPTSLPEHHNDAQLDCRNFEKPVADASIPKFEASTESPPDQVMERSSNSKYRIPSHVFSRSKSNSPVDWSVASNDSLFSIQMGNMSFTKDSFLWRADDVGTPVESSPSGHQMFNYSGPLPPSREATFDTTKEVPRPSESKDQIQATPAAEDHISYHPEENGSKAVDGKSNDVETMKKVLSLKESQYQVHEKSTANGNLCRLSAESSNSTKSFAFPILEGADKGASISIASSPKLGAEQQQTQSQTATTPEKQELPDQQSELNSPTATQSAAGSSWFPCFSCFSCRR